MLARKIIAMIGVFAVTALGLAACGDSSSGNSISGNIQDTSSNALMNAATDGSDTSSPYEGAIVELRDSEGNVIDTDIVDSNGNYYFSSVDEGDYTIALIDDGEEITSVDVSVIDGDNVILDGNVGEGTADWTIDYEVNQNEGLQNEDQNQNAINIAAAANVSVSEVLDMRNSGMGWGEICHALGVHPSELGRKHSFNPKKKSKVDKKGKGGNKGCNDKNKDKNPNCSDGE